VLFSIDLVGDRPVDDLRTEVDLPEQRSGARVERVKISFPATGEEKVARGGEDAAIADIVLFEFPFMLAGPWIDSNNGAIADVVGPIVNRIAPADPDS